MPAEARGDYAICAGDQYSGQYDPGPVDLPSALALTQSRGWPNLDNPASVAEPTSPRAFPTAAG